MDAVGYARLEEADGISVNIGRPSQPDGVGVSERITGGASPVAESYDESATDSLPTGVTYEGTLDRAVPAGKNPLGMSYTVAADGRYTAPGQAGLYFAPDETTVEAEFVPNSAPAGVTYDGPLYRAVPAGGDPLDISYSVNANGRYTAPGQGGLYFASNSGTVEAEFVNNGSSLIGRDLNVFPNSSVNNLLDLTDPAVRSELGVSLEDLTRTGGTAAWRYEATQPLGAFAQSNGFNGIIAPSAQADGGVNLILFGSKGVK